MSMWSEPRPACVAVLAVSLLLAGCGAPAVVQRPAAPAVPPVPEIATADAPAEAPSVEIVDQVVVQPWSFDPTIGQSAGIAYTLAGPARVTLSIYGPNHELVARPLDGEPVAAGRQRAAWDGRDLAGQVVADEAYYPVIEAVAAEGSGRYDPAAFSGGERINPRDIHFRPREGLVSYVLPEPSRVLVRAGLDPGPMLATLVNWAPRGAGAVAERWSGRDQEGRRAFADDPAAVVIVQAYALPESSIIAFGNEETSYRERYLAWGAGQPARPLPARDPQEASLLSPHWGQPVHLDKDPPVRISFPELEDAAADLAAPLRLTGDRALVRLEVPDEESRRFLRSQRFELVAFVDDQRVDEAEQGHLPFNWSWDLRSLPPGEHWLTLNLVSFRQHVGTASRRVEVVRASEARPAAAAAPEVGTPR